MATGSRTLKLSILADVDQLNKSLKAANSDVETSSSKISDFGKKAGLAFAAAAAAAGAYAIKESSAKYFSECQDRFPGLTQFTHAARPLLVRSPSWSVRFPGSIVFDLFGLFGFAYSVSP